MSNCKKILQLFSYVCTKQILFIVIVDKSNTLDWLKLECNVTTHTNKRTFLCEFVC